MHHVLKILLYCLKLKSYLLFATSMQVKTIVFDKTGTLTVGKPAVVSAVLFSEFSMEVLCDMAISVEVFFMLHTLLIWISEN